MRKILVALSLVLIGMLLPWQIGHEPEALAASAFVAGRAVIRPTTIIAGQTATMSTYQFAIAGSADFATDIAAGLELMQRVSPADYAIIADNVTEIREGPQNYAWGDSRAIQISAGSARHSRAYAGAIVLHEAVHVRNWFADDLPAFGCEGEAKSLRAQAAYLHLADEPALAAWVESLIGNWC